MLSSPDVECAILVIVCSGCSYPVIAPGGYLGCERCTGGLTCRCCTIERKVIRFALVVGPWNMRATLGFLFVLFICQSAAAVTHVITSHGESAGRYRCETVPGPTTLSWELATADNRRVGLTIHGIQPSPVLAQRGQLIIREDSVIDSAFNMHSGFTLDWTAFEAAANDPSFTQSLVTFGGMTSESPLIRTFSFDEHFELFGVSIILEDYIYPSPGAQGIPFMPHISVGASSPPPIVPEPNEFVLMSVAATFLGLRRRV